MRGREQFSSSGTNCSMAAALPYAIGAAAAYPGRPLDFVKFAEACGATGVRIEDPTDCGDQLARGFDIPGPAIIECVVDPHEPPIPAKVKKQQISHLDTQTIDRP